MSQESMRIKSEDKKHLESLRYMWLRHLLSEYYLALVWDLQN